MHPGAAPPSWRDSGPFVVSAGYDLTVTLSAVFKDQVTPARLARVSVTGSQVNRVVVTDDHKIGIAANPLVTIHDVMTVNSRALQYSGHVSNVTDLAFAATQFFTCSEDRTWQIWDRRQQTRHIAKTSSSSALNALALDATRQVLVTGNEKGEVELWDIGSAKKITEKRVSPLAVRSVALSHDGTRLVVGCHDKHALVLSVGGGDEFAELHRIAAHTDTLLRVAVSGDDSLFVTTSADSSAKLWSLATGALVHELRHADQKKWVWDAAFTNDARFVVTGGTDRVYRTWSCETGEMTFVNDGMHTKGITALAILN